MYYTDINNYWNIYNYRSPGRHVETTALDSISRIYKRMSL